MQLDTKTLKRLAPSAFATSHNMSERYAQIKTTELLDRLADGGYVPVAASQDNPRLRPIDQVTHLITLRHESLLKTKKAAGQIPQLLLVNSHNGRTKCRLYGGFYRFACANGLVIGRDQMSAELRHSGDALVEASVFAEDIGDHLKKVNGVIDDWGQIELSNYKANKFARDAAELRFGEKAKQYDTSALLNVRRPEDEGRDLWSIFNVVQENTVVGGIEGETATGRRVKTRAVTAIEAGIEYNRKLWELAEKVAA